MVAGAEGHGRVDQNAVFMGTNRAAIMAAVDDKPSGTNRCQILQGLFHPVFIFQRFFGNSGTNAGLCQHHIDDPAHICALLPVAIDGDGPDCLFLVGLEHGDGEAVLFECGFQRL